MTGGTAVSHYRIVKQLGRGGMGVVFEAEDFSLGRHVALKFLPPELAGNRQALERFKGEARSASALNHPNICTIYEIGEHEGQSFIAMELLRGDSLDRLIAGAPLPVARILDIAIQLADALEAAHGHGIIHRDIKPANIFVTEQGPVKVLDFGLAKTAAESVAAGAADADAQATISAALTSPGTAVGTVAYMSPEQARAEKLDARSDLFSFGAVLYEMATGRVPFAGATTAIIFDGILNREPTPLAELNPLLPPRLGEIIFAALEKDRELRSQTAGAVRAELKRLKRDLAGGRTSSSSTRVAAGASASAPLSSSARVVLLNEAKRHKISVGLASLVVAMLLAAAGFGFYRLLKQPPQRLETMSIVPVTQVGKAWRGAISPDGKYVAYELNEIGRGRGVFVRQVETGSDVEVLPLDPDYSYAGLTFSRDGNYLYVVRSERGRSGFNYAYQMPALGGPLRQIARDVNSPLSLSPDGKGFAFVRRSSVGYKTTIIVVEFQSGQERVLATRTEPEGFVALAWSPDGKWIAAAHNVPQTNYSAGALVLISTADGQERPFFSFRSWIGAIEWLPDGGGLVFVAAERGRQGRGQLFELSYPSAELRRITNDLSDYRDINLSGDGKTLVAAQKGLRTGVYEMTAGQLPRQVVAPGLGWYRVNWLSDNLLAAETETDEAYTVNLSSGRQTLFHKHGSRPIRCGRYIVFSRTEESAPAFIWRAEPDGSNAVRLAEGDVPTCPTDGKFVAFDHWDGSRDSLWRVGIDGTNPTQLADDCFYMRVSPDGKLIGFRRWQPDGAWKLFVISSDGGPPLYTFDNRGWSDYQWAPDSNALDGVRLKPAPNIWRQPLAGGQPRQLTNFQDGEHTFSFAWSPDGKQLALVRGHSSSDIVLIKNFQ